MKNDDDKKSAPLHLCIPSKFTCMLILLLLRFLWKPSPSLPYEQETAIQFCYLSRTKLQENIPFATVSVSVRLGGSVSLLCVLPAPRR